jgi:hypothetical protein
LAAGSGECSPSSAVSRQLRFTPLADNDIAETFTWYESARPEIGEEFLADLQRALDFVMAYPLSLWQRVNRFVLQKTARTNCCR